MSNLISRTKYLVPRRIDLFSELSKDIDHLCNEVFGSSYLNGKKSKGYPAVDAIRSEDELVFNYAVPGVKLKDLNVEVHHDEQGSLLSVSGRLSSNYKYNEDNYQIRELSSQEFRRVVRLPDDVTEDDPQAELKDGILKLTFKTLQKDNLENSVKKITIKE